MMILMLLCVAVFVLLIAVTSLVAGMMMLTTIIEDIEEETGRCREMRDAYEAFLRDSEGDWWEDTDW